MRCFLNLLFLGLAGLVAARSSSGNSVLVVLDPSLSKDKFSIFFKDLEGVYSSSLKVVNQLANEYI